MKLLSSWFAFVVSSLGLCTLNFAVILPAQASIMCEPGTITYYANASLATCLLVQDVNVQISNSSSGIYNFPCKAQNYITFDEKGNFQSCILATEITIMRGNSEEICRVGYKVNISVLDNLLINCQHYN